MSNVTIINANTENAQKEKLRCAAYCRVSSSSEDQLNSYAAQIRYYSSVFDESDTEELVDIYADEGITGTSEEKRDEFKRLISDCKKGKIDRIYTKSISRYARNTKDCLESIRLLKALGVTIYFEKENIDTAKMSDEMMITIMGGLAQEESTSISQNQRWSVLKRMQNGTFEQSIAPYGYVKRDGKLVVDPEKATVVRQIYAWYLSGIGISLIAQKLIRAGIPLNNYNKPWKKSSIKYILTNEKYIGDTRLQKYYTTDSIPTTKHWNNGEKEQYYIKNTHEAIIKKEDFIKVQELIANNTKLYYKAAGEKSPLGSKIKCGFCGGTYKRKNRNGNPYWVCTNHDSGISRCAAKAIPEERIKQAFVSLCNKLILHYKEILVPLQRGLNELNSIKFKGNSRVLDIHKEIASLKEQRHVIARLRKKGFMDEQKYNEQLTSLEGKIKRQENELKKISKADENDEMLEQLDLLISCFEKKDKTITKFDSELFETIVDNAIIEEKTILFSLISGLEIEESI